MINITLNEAKVALEIIQDDIDSSIYSEPDYKNIEVMRYFFDRAVLFHRLTQGINKESGAAQ